MVVGKNGSAQDQELVFSLLFQADVRQIVKSAEFFRLTDQVQLCIDNGLNAVELSKLCRYLFLLREKKPFHGGRVLIADEFPDLLERHAKFFQAGDGEKDIALVFAVIPVALLVSISGGEKPDLIIMK